MTSLFRKARDRTSRERRTGSGNAPQAFNPQNPLDAPSEVAQAVAAFSARRPGEISFSRGDFFYVVNPIPSPDGFIEIYDPTRGTKGRAPASAFKMFEKTHQGESSAPGSRTVSSASLGQTQGAGMGLGPASGSIVGSATGSPQFTSSAAPAPLPTLFGIVLYDFNAERSDELSVKTGDKIIICAHHDFEWYIAKFVDKIGEVGLVPVAYVQLIDTLTKIPYKDQPSAVIQREKLPSIDEWKAIRNRHKASVRPVGEAAAAAAAAAHAAHAAQRKSLSRSPSSGSVLRTRSSASSEGVYPTFATIESFSSSNSKFWFHVTASLSNGQRLSLCRYYEDFFNFHQRILSTWPREGGKFDSKDRKDRIIPYIPGPVVDVNESLTHKCMADLNDYLESLITLPDYISKSSVVASFFDPLEGDVVGNQQPHPVRNAPALRILNQDQPSTTTYDKRYSQSHQDRLSQYEPKHSSHNSGKLGEHNRSSSKGSLLTATPVQTNSAVNGTPPPSGTTVTTTSMSSTSTDSPKIKIKFYYKDDIFAMNVPVTIPLADLKQLVVSKIDEADVPGIVDKIVLLPKDQSDSAQAITSNATLWNSPAFVDKGKLQVVV